MMNQFDKNIEYAVKLLPAWFIPRMMGDCWTFGLLLVGGHLLVIESITAVHQGADGSIWINVEMLHHRDVASSGFLLKDLPFAPFGAPTSRLTASINAAHVVAAFELADT